MAVDYLGALNTAGSGINLKELSATLSSVDVAPRKAAAEKRVVAGDLSISALGLVRARFEALGTAVKSLVATPVLTANSNDPAVSVVVTDRGMVRESVTSIGVQQLSSRQVLEFPGFASADAPIGAGRINVEFGVWFGDAGDEFAANPALPARGMTVPADATLADLVLALNQLGGITARVLDKGDGTFSLGVVSEPGAGSAMRLTVTENPLIPGLSAFDTTATNATAQISAATDAILTVDGISISRPTNTLTDVIPGATLTLTAPTGAARITTSREETTALTSMKNLVEEINATLSQLKSVTSRGANGAISGALAGDRGTETMKTQILALLAAPLNGHGDAPVFLSSFGLTTQRDGSLTLDESRFSKTFAATPKAFDALFSNGFSSPTSGVEVAGVLGSAAESGSYSFKRDAVTGLATLNGKSMVGTVLEDGRTRYVMLDGPLGGMLVTTRPEVTDATVRFGRSFASLIDASIQSALSSDGSIAKREASVTASITEADDQLATLALKETNLEARYLKRFAAMEQVITKMKSTSSYLTNLVDSWNSNKDN